MKKAQKDRERERLEEMRNGEYIVGVRCIDPSSGQIDFRELGPISFNACKLEGYWRPPMRSFFDELALSLTGYVAFSYEECWDFDILFQDKVWFYKHRRKGGLKKITSGGYGFRGLWLQRTSGGNPHGAYGYRWYNAAK